MSSAVIGYTGFVGGNLVRQHEFDSFYNSKNIHSIIGESFDLVVCSGAPAIKWLANKEPIKDRDNLKILINCLSQVSVKKLILISTVDVYPLPTEVDEDTKIDRDNLHPYGKNRLELEDFVRNNFDSFVVRLPGLFGEGLKKNIIYDFLNDNIIDKIHEDSIFQFYNLNSLWNDIQKSLAYELALINFATEPLSVKEVASKAFGFEFVNLIDTDPAKYNFKTKYSHVFGSQNSYIRSKDQVIQDLKEFVSYHINQRKNRSV